MTALVLALTVIVAALTVLVAGLLRAYASVLQRLHALDGGGPGAVSASAQGPRRGVEPLPAPGPAGSRGRTGDRAADIAGETPGGELVTARVTGVAHETLLLFLSSSCPSCEVFWGELGAAATTLPAGVRVLVVAQSPESEDAHQLRELRPPGVDVVLSSTAWRDYEVPGSPYAVLVDGERGTVRGEGTGQSLRQVVDLVTRSGGTGAKSSRDAAQEAQADRELLAAGIRPGDPRLYGGG